MTKQKNRFENNSKKTVVIFVSILIISDFLIGTISIRPSYRLQNCYFHHGLTGNFKGKIKWFGSKYSVYTNSLGFRDSVNRKVWPVSNKYRILFIGDSFAEGIGVIYDKTFVGIIDKVLHKQNIEVLNASVVGYSPKLYYLKIKYLIEKEGLKFNELYVYIDISDIPDEIGYENYRPQKRCILTKINNLLRGHSVIYNMMSYVPILYRNVISKFHKPQIDSWTQDEIVFNKRGKKGLLLAKNNMDMLLGLCKKYGIKVTLAVYPWPSQIKNNDINSPQVLFWEDYCRKKGIGFINYFPDFINGLPDETINKYFLKDDFHWNGEGHRIIAQKWLEFYGQRNALNM
ncbi:MAG: hypothetical protein PHT41_03845 [Candidatus Omnitrophica bacterium]|nr:hypothetical protein [Candidatus Omnitrophota bacterium]MDD5238263.1 hypothetical protein [Candidatus Omnitrophota bacterium]